MVRVPASAFPAYEVIPLVRRGAFIIILFSFGITVLGSASALASVSASASATLIAQDNSLQGSVRGFDNRDTASHLVSHYSLLRPSTFTRATLVLDYKYKYYSCLRHTT